MAFEVIAPPTLAAALLPGERNVRLTWGPYVVGDKAGHQIVGYRLYRSQGAGAKGDLIAGEGTLGPAATQHDDLAIPLQGTVFYTLVAVEPNDFGSRPYGEGGNVPYGV